MFRRPTPHTQRLVHQQPPRVISLIATAGQFRRQGSRRVGVLRRRRRRTLDKNALYLSWIEARETTGIVFDTRLHNLHRSHASNAVMNVESPHVAGRLLGHQPANTSKRYIHLIAANLSQVTEQVAIDIQGKLMHRRKFSRPNFARRSFAMTASKTCPSIRAASL